MAVFSRCQKKGGLQNVSPQARNKLMSILADSLMSKITLKSQAARIISTLRFKP